MAGYVERRRRCLEIRSKLAAGEVRSIDDLITLNLDIRQFAQDVIENTESPDLLRAFWEVMRKVTVLDPTCGSGAFLFAAMNILEPMYEGCLGRMREFVEIWGDVGKQAHPNYYKWFAETLQRVEEHPNTRYFIYKSIILNNLYGVDFMPEAVEICKLRLFLKLAAEVEPDRSEQNMGLEPLPDIDFNIRAGNTLVGFATYDEVKKAVASTLDFDDAMATIEEKAVEIDGLFSLFREQQEMLAGVEISPHDKQQLRGRLKPLEDELNAYLARQYVIDAKYHKAKYKKWLESHQPFHWFVEFHWIMSDGGFDVVIGNPPYVEYSKVRGDYRVTGYETEACGNLYAYVVERSCRLVRTGARLGLIVPLGGFSTSRMVSYQNLLCESLSLMHLSYFSGDAHPSVMFDGVKYRLAIALGQRGKPHTANHTSAYLRWYANERPCLFPARVGYAPCPFDQGYQRFAKLGDLLSEKVLCKLLSKRERLALYERKVGSAILHYHRSPVFWIRAMDFEPVLQVCDTNSVRRPPP